LAGRLDGILNGRPLSIVAEDHQVTLLPDGFGALFELIKIRRSWRFVELPLGMALRRANIRLLVRLGWFGQLQLLPNPSFLLRLFLPRK
jgi:hypothetical protein